MNSERLQGDYVLLRADTVRLLLPQTQLLDIVHLQNRATTSAHCITQPAELITVADGVEASTQHFQYATLSDELALLPDVPVNRFVVTTHQQTGAVYWCWSEVQLLNNLSLMSQLLPPIVRTELTPFQGIVTLADGKQAFTCSFDDVLHYLAQR